MTKIHKIQAVQNILVDFGKVHVSQMDTRCYAHVVEHGYSLLYFIVALNCFHVVISNGRQAGEIFLLRFLTFVRNDRKVRSR